MVETNTTDLERIEDEFLDEVLEDGEIGAEIVLENPDEADYQIQRIARLQREQAKIAAYVARKMGRLQLFLQTRHTILQNEIDWRSTPLEIYVRDAHRRSNGKVKTLDLPHGKLKLRVEREKVECDQVQVLAWADRYDDPTAINFVVVQRRVLKPELLAFIKSRGEAVDGATIIPPGEPIFHLEIKA